MSSSLYGGLEMKLKPRSQLLAAPIRGEWIQSRLGDYHSPVIREERRESENGLYLPDR